MSVSLFTTIEARVQAGEQLVPIHKVALLAHIDPATRWRWCVAGRLPSVRMGARFYTTTAAVCEWLAAASETKRESKGRREKEIDDAMRAVMGS